MFMKIQRQNFPRNEKERKKFGSTAEQVSNEFLRFISQFNVSIPCKKSSFIISRKKFSLNTGRRGCDDEKRKRGKFSSCFFLFPHGVLLKKQLEKFSFLVVAEKSKIKLIGSINLICVINQKMRATNRNYYLQWTHYRRCLRTFFSQSLCLWWPILWKHTKTASNFFL